MERRKTLLRLAVGVALMTLLILAGLSLGRGIFLNQAAGGGFNTQGAAAVWDTVLRFLKTDLRWTLLIFGAGRLRRLAGRTGPLRRVDPLDLRQGRPLGGGAVPRAVASGAGRAAAESGRVRRSGGWIVEHISGLRIVGVVVAGLFLRLRRQPHRVEPAGHCDRAGGVSRAAATGGRVGPQGGGPRPTTPGPADGPEAGATVSVRRR